MSRILISLLSCCLIPIFGCYPEPDELPGESRRVRADEPIRPVFERHEDGAVTWGEHRYESLESFHRSHQFQTGGMRCGSEEPAFLAEAIPSDCSFSSTTIESEYAPGLIYEIPVVFHVISQTGGQGDIPDALILSQLDVLNEDFQAIPGTLGGDGSTGPLDTGIRFVLAAEDPTGNLTTGIQRITNDAYYTDPGPGMFNDMKVALNWDTSRYFNIYTNDGSGGGTLGYATFPQTDAATAQDGVVLNHVYVGRNAPGAMPYNLGRTGTHEVGHYLGLFHTFQGGCGNLSLPYMTGDLLADTNAEDGPAFGCPMPMTSASLCPGVDFNPTENYMDYTDDACMERFTIEQANRMRCSMVNYRPELFRVLGGTVTANFTSAVTDQTITFTDTSVDSDGIIVSWSWNFGDGTTSMLQHPSHLYTTPGVYMVTLTVTDDSGESASVTMTVITEGPPRAAFDWTATGLTVDFTDTTLEAGNLASWSWNFGDGTTSNEQNPSHTYAISSTYVVNLTVMDDEGDMDSVTHFIIAGEAPTAAFTYAANGHEVMFTDTSNDSDGTLAGWRWDFGDGVTSLIKNPTHTYAGAAIYDVTLEVFDEGGLTGSVSMPVIVQDPPIADFDVSVDGVVAMFNDTSVDPSGTLIAWEWDLGDGNTTTQQNHAYIYEESGIYDVTLSVTSDTGATKSVTKSVNINQSPMADFEFVIDGSYVDFTDTSVDMDGTVVAWAWGLGDGNVSTEQNPRHVYLFGGVYTVSLTVEDDSGNTATILKELTITLESPDAGVSDAGPGNGGDGDGGGCGCEAGGQHSGQSPTAPALVVLLGVVWLMRRRLSIRI